MKKLFSLLMVLITTTCLWAYDFQANGLYYKITSNVEPYTVEVTAEEEFDGYVEYSTYPQTYNNQTIINIPSTIKHGDNVYTVTSIANATFAKCYSLVSVTIPHTVTKVGKGLFYGCTSLQDVTLSSNIQNITPFYEYHRTGGTTWDAIERGFFEGCTALRNVTLPINLKEIGSRTFANSGVESITLATNIAYINDYAFYNCKYLTKLICYPSTPPVTDFTSEGGFSTTNYNSLTIYVPCDYLHSYVSDDVFGMFKNIKCIEASSIKTNGVKVSTTSNSAIFSWQKETNTAAYTIDIYQDDALYTSLTFNSQGHLKNISYAPSRDSQSRVTSAEKTVAGYRFTIEGLNTDTQYSYDFIASNEDNNVIKSYSGYFTTGSGAGTTDFVTINEVACGIYVWYGQELTESGIYTQTLKNALGNDSVVTLELTILPDAIVNEYNITLSKEDFPYEWRGQQIYAGGTYTDEITYANSECDSIIYVLNVTVASTPQVDKTCGDNLSWEYSSSVLLITGYGEMYDFTASSAPWNTEKNDIKYILLPENLNNIGSFAFANCNYISTISIPSSIVKIGDGAFENCRLLTTISFANKGQLTTIGNWAFYNCHELKDVVIPEGVTEIGHAAFYGCTYLKDLTLPASLQSIADNGFAGCSKLAQIQVNAIIPPQVDARTFEDVDRSISVIVPDESVEQYKSAPIWKEFNVRGKSSTGVDNIISTTNNIQKIIRDGQLIIVRDGVEYNAVGQEL